MFIRSLRTLRYLLAFFLISSIVGCNNDPLDVNVSNIDLELEILRLDNDMFSLDPTAGQTNTKALEELYGQFFIDYCDGVLRIGNPKAPSFPYSVAQFITDESMQTLYEDSQAEFEDLSSTNKQLNQAFTYFKYHFPDSTVPRIVYNISALNYAIVATESTLAIGLDMFLGADYPVYPMVGLPKYMFENMKREQIVPQAMKGWLQSMYETDAERSTLLEYMVFEGKILYTLDAVLRESPDSVKIGFRPGVMAWCNEFEVRIWQHLVDAELLYTTEYMDINKWVNQAPFIAGIPKQSPGRLGQWVGWQIVRQYMKDNPEMSVQELMANQNAQDILARSKYKPK